VQLSEPRVISDVITTQRVLLATAKGEIVCARVPTFEGVDPDRAAEEAGNIRSQMEGADVPEGLEGAKGVQTFIDRQSGKSLAIVLFDSEEDLRRGDEALNAMSREEGQGRRTSVDFYEVQLNLIRSAPS
jgi:hypothetical protein